MKSTFTVICNKDTRTYKNHTIEINPYGLIRILDDDMQVVRIYPPSGYNHVDFDVNVDKDD